MKTRFLTLALGLLATVSVTSCQTTTTGLPESTVMCDKCKTVWVNSPVTVGTTGRSFVAYQARKEMQCPDCESAVSNFFKTGELKHTCSSCKGALTHCTRH